MILFKALKFQLQFHFILLMIKINGVAVIVCTSKVCGKISLHLKSPHQNRLMTSRSDIISLHSYKMDPLIHNAN